MTPFSRCAWVLPWAALLAPPAAVAQVEFRTLGDLPGGRHISRGLTISGDGRVIAGISSDADWTRAVAWINGEGPILIHPKELMSRPGSVWSSSYTGDHLVGSVGYPYSWHALEPKRLPTVTPAEGGYATAISDDGRIIYGLENGPSGGTVRWIDNVPAILRSLPGDARPLFFSACSGDGSVAAGMGELPSGWWVSIIVRDKRVRFLGHPPCGPSESDALGLSSDGLVAVGVMGSCTQIIEAYLWTEATGIMGLGDLPTGVSRSLATCISRDGRVVGGIGFTDGWPGQHTGFIWDAVRGMRNVNTILDEAGINRDGWFIFEVNALSGDGSAMTGTAVHLVDGRHEAYLVRVPPPCLADCDGDGVADFNDLLCFLNRFGRAQDPRLYPVDHLYCDLARDDVVDFNDFLAFLNLYNRGCP